MARARNIKPGLYKNEDLAECSIWARFVFPGLWMLADREGRLEDRPKRIKGELLPYDDADMDALLNELAKFRFIARYQVDGERYIQVLKFLDHQTPHVREQASSIPEMPAVIDAGERQVESTTKASPGSDLPSPRSPDSLNPSSLNPESIEKKTARQKDPDGACTFKTFLLRCKEAEVTSIPPDDPIFEYTREAHIPDDWLRMCWLSFKDKYLDADKRYKGINGWRAAFRNSVRQGWFELWWHDGENYKLTSKGLQAMTVMKSRELAKAEHAS
jgi:hypothetical protein